MYLGFSIAQMYLGFIIAKRIYYYTDVLRNYLIPFMKNHLSSDNIDEQLLQVERLKVTAANNIDWQLSFDAADRRRI